jgi:hypothetical protein
MKKIIITLIVAGLAALGFSLNASAQEFHIKKLECIQTEGIFTADAIYVRYRVNNGPAQRYPVSGNLSFTEGTERSDLLYISTREGDTIHLELWDCDTFDADDYIGSFDVRMDYRKERSITLRQQDGIAVYRLTYVIE